MLVLASCDRSSLARGYATNATFSAQVYRQPSLATLLSSNVFSTLVTPAERFASLADPQYDNGDASDTEIAWMDLNKMDVDMACLPSANPDNPAQVLVVSTLRAQVRPRRMVSDNSHAPGSVGVEMSLILQDASDLSGDGGWDMVALVHHLVVRDLDA